MLLTIVVSSPFVSSAPASSLVHDVDDVLLNYTYSENDELYFHLPSVQTWELITDISDPDILNKGDGSFHPFHNDVVEDAVAQVSYPLESVDVEIFVLPYPRRDALGSSAMPGRVILSPGVWEYIPEQEHFTVTHELGHIVHRKFMPEDTDPLWQEYRELRNITDTSVYNNTAIHKNRPTEIFAEDFRFLFGSALANYCGTIENGDLPLPTAVPGLKDFFLSFPNAVRDIAALKLETFPNPFNPVLNISFSAGGSSSSVASTLSPSSLSLSTLAQSSAVSQEASRLFLRVFDVEGRLVKTLVDGELPSGSQSAFWTGTDEWGRDVSSGVYFLRLELGQDVVVKRVILAR